MNIQEGRYVVKKYFEVVKDSLGKTKIFGPLKNIKKVVDNQEYKYCQVFKDKVISVLKEKEILQQEE